MRLEKIPHPQQARPFNVTVLQPLPCPGSVLILARECEAWASLVLRDAALLLGW